MQKIYEQVILNLLEQTDKPCHLSGYDEEKMLPLYLEDKNIEPIYHVYCNKLILCYLFQDYSQAVKNATMAEKYLDGVTASLVWSVFYFYDSLARLALCHDSYGVCNKHAQQKNFLKKVAKNQKKLKKWAFHAPMNFLHKFELVEAERARVLGQDKKARKHYDKAIALAHENEYFNEEALACELTGLFFMKKGLSRLALHYLHEAHNAYSRWGARAKVKDLEKRYPELCFKLSKPSVSTTFSLSNYKAQTNSGALDLVSVLKASQAIAGEIEFTRLKAKMMKIVIENAGAQRGFLLHERNGQWLIGAAGLIGQDEVKVETVDILDSLPTSIINYVVHTKENIILNDAVNHKQFNQDKYIKTQQPKSILCTPLLNKTQLMGILYLENNLATGAFTPDRLQVLNMLSAQIAISIENATLYTQLEEKVTERTQALSEAIDDLKATQAQLIESEKMASLGGLVAGVAHEINTPLGIGITAASTLANKTETVAKAYDNKQLKGSALKAYFDTALHSSRLILNNIERAGELVQSFKQVAVDQTHLEKRTFRVKKYVEDTLVNLTPHLKKTRHSVTVNGDEQIEINSYPGAFSQIITNFVMNSIKHAYQKGEAGKMCFDIRRDSEQLIFEYQDNGCGIPTENMNKIFDPFFTTVRVQGGSGLGLHVVYNLVTQKLKGTIRCESKVGVGTTFILNLPFQIFDE